MKYLLSFILLAVVSCTYFEELQRLQNDYANCPSLKLAGNALIVVKNGQTIYKQTGGKRDIQTNLPVNNDTVWALGSISKQFTTILLAQLYEDGLIDFDTPVKEYIPEFKVDSTFATATITLHDILTHHTGLARNDFLMLVNTTKTTSQFLEKLKSWPFATSPRYQATYNSWTYVIARIIIERVTNQPYETVVKTRILQPLGMTHSYPTSGDAFAAEPQNYAYGHALDTNNVVVPIIPKEMNRIFDGLLSCAGGVHASVNDVEKYLIALNTANVPNLTSSILDLVARQKVRAVAPRTLDATIPFGLYFGLYSYGLMNGEYKGHKYYAHNGGTNGQSTYILNFPEDGVSIALLTNNHGVNSLSYFLLFTQIFDIVNGASYDNSKTCIFASGEQLMPKTYPSATITNRQKYSGSYTNKVYGDIQVDEVPGTTNQLQLTFGALSGKLRPYTGTNKFVWYTENSFEGNTLYFTFNFNVAGIKAKSLSVNLDPTVPDEVFTRKISPFDNDQ